MTNSQSRQAEIDQNKAKVISILNDVEGLERSLRLAQTALKENSDPALVLTLHENVDHVELMIEETQSNAMQWGEQWGNDQELIAAISEEYDCFEWIFDYCDLD